MGHQTLETISKLNVNEETKLEFLNSSLNEYQQQSTLILNNTTCSSTKVEYCDRSRSSSS